MADKKRKSAPIAVSLILKEAFNGKPIAQRLKEVKIWEVWQTVVGEQIANRAQPVSIRNGILTVCVASGPWMQQLNYIKANIINQINEQVGEQLVTEIFLKAGTLPTASTKEERPTLPKRPLTEFEIEEIAAISAELSDPELRETLANLLKTHRSSTQR